MIVPGASMGVSETVFVDNVPTAPDSISAVLYRWVGSTRSASGVAVNVDSTANDGEYLFTWVNNAGWSRTDDLELVAIPVIESISHRTPIFRTHGDVDAAMRGTDSALLAENYTAPDNAGITAAIANVPTAEENATATRAKIDEKPIKANTLHNR